MADVTSNSERSNFIFQIAEALGVSLDSRKPDVLDDLTLTRFRRRYEKLAALRSQALREHLTASSTLFRCFLPYSYRVFDISHQVLWYLDEIIVRDPLERLFKLRQPGNTENVKQELVATLQQLNKFRHGIEDGYLLLAGEDLIPSENTASSTPDVDAILAKPEIVSALDRTVRYGLEVRENDEVSWYLYEARLDFANNGAMVTKEIKRKESFTFEVNPGGVLQTSYAPLALSTAEEVKQIAGKDVVEEARNMYAHEVDRTLHHVGVAAKLDCAILFDRAVDVAILKARGETGVNRVRQTAAVEAFQLLLPYVAGIPDEHLIEVRQSVPTAFQDFRLKMVDIVSKAMNEAQDGGVERVRLTIEQEVAPAISALQTEMSATIRKTRLLGYGVPLLSATAALTGGLCGMGWPALGILAAGAYEAVKAAAESVDSRTKAQANPFYFLWQAHNR